MKKLLILPILLITISINAQVPFFGNRDFVSADKNDTLKLRYESGKATWKFNKKVIDIQGGLEADSINLGGIWYKTIPQTDITFNGSRTVTRTGLPAVSVGGNTIIEWANNYFFPSTSPTCTLTVSEGTSREFMATGTALTVDLSWSVTRPVACLDIQSISVNGTSIVPFPINETQTQGGVLGQQSLNRNVNTTYTITSTASDGKTGTASQTVTWMWKRYWGSFASAVPPTDVAFSISDAQILALSGNELSTTRVQTRNGINAAGNYLVFAWPTAWGEPSFVINGLVSTAFKKVRSNSFTNASGGSTTYDVWVSNTTQAGAISQFQIN